MYICSVALLADISLESWTSFTDNQMSNGVEKSEADSQSSDSQASSSQLGPPPLVKRMRTGSADSQSDAVVPRQPPPLELHLASALTVVGSRCDSRIKQEEKTTSTEDLPTNNLIASADVYHTTVSDGFPFGLFG